MLRSLRTALLLAALATPFIALAPHSGQAWSLTPTPSVPATPRTALQAELEQRAELAQKEVAALQLRHDATTDYALRRALQQRIEAAKREGQLDFFRIQLRYAQAAGRLEQVKELEAVLEAQLKQPVTPLLPLPAAAPAAPAPRAARPARPVKGGGR